MNFRLKITTLDMCAVAKKNQFFFTTYFTFFMCWSDKWRYIHKYIYIYIIWEKTMVVAENGISLVVNTRSSLQGRSWKMWSVCWEEIVPPVCLRATSYPSPSRPEWKARARQTAPTQVQPAVLSRVLLCTSRWFALQFLDSLPFRSVWQHLVWRGDQQQLRAPQQQ